MIYGKFFKNLDEVRPAAIESQDTYNRYWRLEKLGFMTPMEARQHYENERLQPVAA